MLPPVYPKTPAYFNFTKAVPKYGFSDSYTHSMKYSPLSVGKSIEFPQSIINFNNRSPEEKLALKNNNQHLSRNLRLAEQKSTQLQSPAFSPLGIKSLAQFGQQQKRQRFVVNKENTEEEQSCIVQHAGQNYSKGSYFPQIRYHSHENQRSKQSIKNTLHLTSDLKPQQLFQFQEQPILTFAKQEDSYNKKAQVKLNKITNNNQSNKHDYLHQSDSHQIRWKPRVTQMPVADQLHLSLGLLNPSKDQLKPEGIKKQMPTKLDTIARKQISEPVDSQSPLVRNKIIENFTNLMHEKNLVSSLQERRQALNMQQQQQMEKPNQTQNSKKSMISSQLSTESDCSPLNSSKIKIVKKKKKLKVPRPEKKLTPITKGEQTLDLLSTNAKKAQDQKEKLTIQVNTKQETIEELDLSKQNTPLQPKSALKKTSTLKPQQSQLLCVKSPEVYERKVSFGRNQTKRYVVEDSFTSDDITVN